MAIDYDINPQRDLDDGTYAALPGTTPGEYVQQNATPMKGRMKKDAEGCHPSRWIHELLNNKFTTCDLFDRARAANLNTPFTWQHTHRLMINGNQSFCSNKTQLLSSVCLDCHFHFVFKMAWDEEHAGQVCSPRQARWPVRDAQFPWHHLVWAGSDTEMNLRKENSKYYPILAREYFVCSAPPCTFQVTLEISEPRMASWWIELLLDYDTIRQTLRHAKEQDPERYAVATEDWAEQAPMNLNTYLKNLLEATSPEKPRSISKRNKRFSVLFGPRCFSIFRELEFEETKDEQDGIDGGSFTPPLPSPPGGPFGSTETGTYRGFIEDVRSEVQCIIHRSGEPAELCTPGLHADLGCVEVNNTNDSHLINIQRYTLLGVLPNQPKEIVVNAYKRQWELLPNKRKELIDALMGIANDLNDEQLADYAATQSSVFDSQLPTQSSSDDDGIVAQALGFLGLQPPNKYNAETIVAAFRQKLSQEPKMANSARQMLLMIAQASTDDTYQAILLMEANGKMSVATAKAVLGMNEDSNLGPEVIAAARTKISLSNDKEEKATYLDALEAIADLTNATDLKQLVAVQRQENGIEIPKGSSIPDASGRPANYDLPVGLENIGNTCYLNSLLQYLFTVKPVRDIALNYENFKLELNDESIKQRLLGGNKMQMDRGEAVVAQAFAQELSDLFNNLETSDKVATRPSQRLANAVLLSTHTLLNDSKPAEPVAGPKPPPLPARPPPEPPAKSSGDVEMANGAVKEERDPVETASTVSSQTLVEDGSDHSYEKVEVPSAATDDQTTDTVMALEEGDSPADTVRPSLKSTETSETIIKSADGTANGEQNADVSMADVDEPQTVDSKVLTALEHQKRSSGTDQQDVEEVMGSILNRLQAAIRPSSVDESTGIQLEKIMETFFVTTINYTKKFDDKTYQKEISFDRSITAFPAPEGSCSLYDALGRNFDQQIIEESKLSRYTAIKTLPPVLHVLIQRSQSMGSKNGNPVEIPETLYLDRYMDAPHDSPTFQQRVQSWAVASRISDLKAQKAQVEAVIPTGPFLESCGEEPTPIINSSWAENDAMEDGVLDFEREENWDFDGPVDDDFLLVSHPTSETPPTTKAPVKPQSIESAERSVREMMSNELRQREEDLEKHHAGLKNIPYRLHAVICHRGQLMSGHYWVWIHDFEQDVWRKYNDSNVDVKRNTDEVLATLSTSGEPYFLCYVRDEDKDAYVNVPRRQRPEQTTDADGDVVVANSEPTPAVEHTQDFSPPFGPQKSD